MPSLQEQESERVTQWDFFQKEIPAGDSTCRHFEGLNPSTVSPMQTEHIALVPAAGEINAAGWSVKDSEVSHTR